MLKVNTQKTKLHNLQELVTIKKTFNKKKDFNKKKKNLMNVLVIIIFKKN